MKQAVLGALIGAGLVGVAVGLFDQRNEIYAQRLGSVPAVGSGGELTALTTPLGDKGQLLTVVDPRQQVLAVYHVELGSGKVKLLSVRNLRWDLQMTYLNNDSPLPQEIRALLEAR